MSLATQVARNTVAQLIGRVLTTILSLGTVAILNQALGAERWGLLSSVTLFGTFFAVVADMGLTTYYLREGAQRKDMKSLTATVFAFRVVSAVVLLSAAPLAASLIPAYQGLVLPVALIALGQFVLLLNQVFVSIFQLELVMVKASIGDVVGRFLILILSFVALKGAKPEDQLVLACSIVIVGGLINLAISYLFSRRYVLVKLQFSARQFGETFRAVLPLALLAVLTVLHFKVDSFLLVLLRDPVEVGIYANSYKIMEILLVLPSMFVGSLFPAFSDALETRDERLQQLFRSASSLLLWAVLPLVLFTSMFAPYIIAVLTRENIFLASGALQVLSFALIAWFIGTLLSHVMILARKQKVLVKLKLSMLALNVVANLIVIPIYGFMGAAWVTVITETVSTVVLLMIVRKQLGLSISLRTEAKGLLIALGFGIVLFLGRDLLAANLLSPFLQASRMLQAGFVVSLACMLGIAYIFVARVSNSLPLSLKHLTARLESR
jgi:O-antigen/teichoic acid export membrane protein